MEVDASKDLVRNVQMNLPIEKLKVQHAMYEYVPKFCDN